jgi:type IV pilus assembly protein PilE
MNTSSAKGFTLIEMMIVVAIVGILAAIAYPSYQQHLQDSRRGECTGAMMSLASAMERDFSRNNAYRDIINTAPILFPGNCPLDGGTATYNLAIANTATTFTITATPVAGGPQASDPCGALTLNQQLIKGQAAGSIDRCWR